MGASVRCVFVVIALLALACCGQPLSGQTPNPVPLINDPLVPTSVAPGGPAFHAYGEWHRLCFGFDGQLERKSAHHPLRERFAARSASTVSTAEPLATEP
jgi:hypothetical protein